MRFGELLGNEPLKQRLIAALDARKLSHSYLISGPTGSGKHTLARLLSAAMECENEGAPCMECTACRKVMSGNHPDVITVDDASKKQVSVELIRAARADVFIRPNEGVRKIFLIPRAHDMNPSAQNALLKILEEPPPYGVFLLLADTPEKLLPTIRSRCSELKLSPLSDAALREAIAFRLPEAPAQARDAAIRRSGGFLGRALELLESAGALAPQTLEFSRCYAAHDTVGLLTLFCSMERWKRNQLAPVLEQMQSLLVDALAVRRSCAAASDAAAAIAETHSAPILYAACRSVRQAIDDCWANVGIANICAGLFIQLR